MSGKSYDNPKMPLFVQRDQFVEETLRIVELDVIGGAIVGIPGMFGLYELLFQACACWQCHHNQPINARNQACTCLLSVSSMHVTVGLTAHVTWHVHCHFCMCNVCCVLGWILVFRVGTAFVRYLCACDACRPFDCDSQREDCMRRSGEQFKRLTIAVEVVANPSIIFCGAYFSLCV